MEITYSYKGVPTIDAFARSNKFFRGLMGPFGSGKSSGCVIEFPRRTDMQKAQGDGVKRARYAAIRNTYRQLEDTTIRTFEQWMPFSDFGRYYSSDHTFVCDKVPGMEFEVLFRALDNDRHVKNLLSLELTGAWINEAREIPKTIVDALEGRVGRYPGVKDGGCDWFGIWADTNPPDDDSWWYKHFEETAPENAELFKQPSGLSDAAENMQNLPPNYYKNLMLGKSDEFVKVYIKGEYGYVADGKPVYPEYNDRVHCQHVEAVKGLPIYRGWDFGLTPACMLSQLLPSGRWIILDELMADDMGIERFGNNVITWCGQKWDGFEFEDIGDPAGESKSQTDEKTCFQILNAMGIKIRGGDQDPNIRIESVKKPLNMMVSGLPAFTLHPRCKTLRKGFMGRYRYRRMQTAQERYDNKPEKNEYSHVHDAAQYVATKLFAAALKKSPSGSIDYYKIYGGGSA